MKLLFFFILVFACAHKKPDYQDPKPQSQDKAHVTIYWPRQWQSQWGEFDFFLNEKPLKRLLNEGYFQFEVEPGEATLKSHHFQDEKFLLFTKLNLQKGRRYFMKLDTQPEDVSLLGLASDVMSVVTVVNGFKSELKLEAGKGSWKDLKNKIEKDIELEDAKGEKAFGYHVIIPMKEEDAVKELKACCSSKRLEVIPEKKIEVVYSGPMLVGLPPFKLNEKRMIGRLSIQLQENGKELSSQYLKFGDCSECFRGVHVFGDLRIIIEGYGRGAFMFNRKHSHKIEIGECDKNFFAGQYICAFSREKKEYKLTIEFKEDHVRHQ